MKTDLPEGTWVRVRNSQFEGGWEFGRLTWEEAYSDRYGDHKAEMCWEIGPMPPIGTTVHKCVWKGEEIQSRGTFIYTGVKP